MNECEWVFMKVKLHSDSLLLGNMWKYEAAFTVLELTIVNTKFRSNLLLFHTSRPLSDVGYSKSAFTFNSHPLGGRKFRMLNYLSFIFYEEASWSEIFIINFIFAGENHRAECLTSYLRFPVFFWKQRYLCPQKQKCSIWHCIISPQPPWPKVSHQRIKKGTLALGRL